MKGKLHITAILVFLSVASYAQKVDLDRFNFTFAYRNLPNEPLSPEYNTYSVKLNSSLGLRSQFDDVRELISVDGWKKVPGETGHVIVDFTVDDLIIRGVDIQERVDIIKDKDGKETGRKYYYLAAVDYTWAAEANVRDYKGFNIGVRSFGASSPWKSSEFTSRSEASEYYKNNRNDIQAKLQKDHVTGATSEIRSWMNASFGYTSEKTPDILWILDSKKHPEYQAQHDQWDAFKLAVATVTPEGFSDEAKDKFAAIIKYFDEIPARFPENDKGHKKLRYAAFYNKARLYIYLDKPELAIKEADALVANDYDAADGKRLKAEAEALAVELKKNNATTRHFPIDLSKAVAPTAGN